MGIKQSISSLRETEGYTHLQIICCGAVRLPIGKLPADKLSLTLDELAPMLVCQKCQKRAASSRVALWKHGMKSYD